ncbi:MAG: hypothetical protein O2895_02570 [Chloroflexi bacterium]|nr:hypothetical protein [Chloroflexota bacterium]MQC28081.1 hypothetical protein [Chloroflexota bacterium]
MLDLGRPRPVPLLAALAVAVLLAAACTNDDDATATATATPDAAGTASPSSTERPATAEPSPTPAAEPEGPSIAPDGRTSNPAINALIETLLGADAAALEARLGSVPGRAGFSAGATELRDVPIAEWTARLGAAGRRLYAVTRTDPQQSPPSDIEITLAVSEEARPVEAWRFAFRKGELVDLVLGISGLPGAVPSVVAFSERFLVLPPLQDLPQPPPGHALSVRTGEAGVDALLALIEAGDADGLLAAVEYASTPCQADALPSCGGEAAGTRVDALPVRAPHFATQMQASADVELLLRELLRHPTTLHAVARVPAGFAPTADHLLIMIIESAPFDWETWGLFERDGTVVGVHRPTGTSPLGLYPPLAVLAAPPDDVTSIDPARRSGDALIDAVLDALDAGDAAALEALVDYQQLGCVLTADGIGHPPICAADEPEGTVVDVLLFAQCEGAYPRASNTFARLQRIAADSWVLFAAVNLGAEPERPGAIRGSTQAVLLDIAGETARWGSLAMTFTNSGIASIVFSCGFEDPAATIWPGHAPSFLLAPPAP